MNPDPFEQRLARQPLRSVPAGWREQIISSVRGPQTPDAIPHPLPRWADWLWPCPQAWAALAAVWVLLLGVNFAADSRPPRTARGTSRPLAPVAWHYAWSEQQRLLVELFPPEPVPPPRPQVKPEPTAPPPPRSESRPCARREEAVA